MNTYISILRGINVGGNRSIKMDALRRLYEDLGFINVRTFIQSGNVIFQYDQVESRDLENDISDKIKTVFSDGYGKTRLPNQFLEQKLKVTATTRNWKTFTELIKISNEDCFDESK